MLRACTLLVLAASASAFAPAAPLASRHVAGLTASSARRGLTLRGGASVKMIDITPNVSFDTIAREWRCKWSADADKASLVKAQDALTEVLSEVRTSPLFVTFALSARKPDQRAFCGRVMTPPQAVVTFGSLDHDALGTPLIGPVPARLAHDESWSIRSGEGSQRSQGCSACGVRWLLGFQGRDLARR